VLKQDPAAYPPIERLVRIATARGHDRANIELRGMRDKDQAHSADPVNEAIDLVQDLIKRGIPAGYYDMRWYVEHGYGVDADQELAFKYYRKAADPGNPEGQCLVGNLLNDRSKHGPEIAAIGLAMQRCAADQGHAKAANEYATDVRLDGISRRP
jgi:TPR repeat protein